MKNLNYYNFLIKILIKVKLFTTDVLEKTLPAKLIFKLQIPTTKLSTKSVFLYIKIF